jgi:hypothetical protein
MRTCYTDANSFNYFRVFPFALTHTGRRGIQTFAGMYIRVGVGVGVNCGPPVPPRAQHHDLNQHLNRDAHDYSFCKDISSHQDQVRQKAGNKLCRPCWMRTAFSSSQAGPRMR